MCSGTSTSAQEHASSGHSSVVLKQQVIVLHSTYICPQDSSSDSNETGSTLAPHRSGRERQPPEHCARCPRSPWPTQLHALRSALQLDGVACMLQVCNTHWLEPSHSCAGLESAIQRRAALSSCLNAAELWARAHLHTQQAASSTSTLGAPGKTTEVLSYG
mmetsp:Transcript_17834/g.49808  ORF Transcript_17834/g.49808 Transcript_17834/m.49808 type:complete len:161 (-) Transcript_17834:445-927(-)|eukprot:scaffold32924_cov23-Tisochrysis_lutea.AAC.3